MRFADVGRTAEMNIELTGYDRPVRLASHTVMRQADMVGMLTFERAFGPAPGCAGRGRYGPRVPPGRSLR